jgi:TonB family protein
MIDTGTHDDTFRWNAMRLALISLLLVAPTAQAETWLQIAPLDSKGGVLLLDTASVDRSSEKRTASFKSVYKSDRPIGTGYRDVPPDARSYRWESSIGHFNCATRTVAVSQSILHGADDQVVAKHEIDSNALKFKEVAPASLGGLLLQSVCATEAESKVGLATIKHIVNPDDYYPSESRRRGEQGAPVVKACVGQSGQLLREPEIADTSGFPDLDGAAVKAAKAMRFAPAVQDGAAVAESCIKFKVKFGRLR